MICQTHGEQATEQRWRYRANWEPVLWDECVVCMAELDAEIDASQAEIKIAPASLPVRPTRRPPTTQEACVSAAKRAHIRGDNDPRPTP